MHAKSFVNVDLTQSALYDCLICVIVEIQPKVLLSRCRLYNLKITFTQLCLQKCSGLFKKKKGKQAQPLKFLV